MSCEGWLQAGEGDRLEAGGQPPAMLAPRLPSEPACRGHGSVVRHLRSSAGREQACQYCICLHAGVRVLRHLRSGAGGSGQVGCSSMVSVTGMADVADHCGIAGRRKGAWSVR